MTFFKLLRKVLFKKPKMGACCSFTSTPQMNPNVMVEGEDSSDDVLKKIGEQKHDSMPLFEGQPVFENYNLSDSSFSDVNLDEIHSFLKDSSDEEESSSLHKEEDIHLEEEEKPKE